MILEPSRDPDDADAGIAVPTALSAARLSSPSPRSARNSLSICSVAGGKHDSDNHERRRLADASPSVEVFDGFNFTATADPAARVRRSATCWPRSRTKSAEWVCSTLRRATSIRAAVAGRDQHALRIVRFMYPARGQSRGRDSRGHGLDPSGIPDRNSVRTPLKNFTNQDGPAGSVETTFSWDYGNVHFISLNQYWNGGTAAGSDWPLTATSLPRLLQLAQRRVGRQHPTIVFVFGHEPPYPFNRTLATASTSTRPAVTPSGTCCKAMRAGLHRRHTHFLLQVSKTPGGMWQIDLGNAGNDGDGDGHTFLNCVVTPTRFATTYAGQDGSWSSRTRGHPRSDRNWRQSDVAHAQCAGSTSRLTIPSRLPPRSRHG